MFHIQINFVLLFTILIIYSTTAENSTTCNRRCGGNSLPYPFGFSEGCKIKLGCNPSGNEMTIGEFQVQNVTFNSILVNLPAKCNRTMYSVTPLFGRNFAPTSNNSFLFQNCTTAVGGCVIPPGFVGSQVELENCNKTSNNIICFTPQNNRSSFLTFNELNQRSCKLLFTAIAIDAEKDPAVSLQFQTVELGWWLEGSCQCSTGSTCTEVSLADGKRGHRCQCREGYRGDGFKEGGGSTGCQRVSTCNASSLSPGGCGRATKVGVLVGGFFAGAAFMAILCVLWSFVKRRSTCLTKQMTVKRLLRDAAGNASVPFYPYKDIERATNSFSDKQRLGTGAFGTVYAGKLHNDEWVAIKKIKQRDTNSVDQVMNEIKLLSSVSHPNLVRLLGCCIEKGEQILVYEYMPNGTLSQHLQREMGRGLQWTIRLTIASETANAIAYLHSAIDPPIYHRDIKSSNILLDYNLNSKVADFGLSRLGIAETSHISTAPQGTPGYVDPQYHQNFHLSDKSDVYSFGVVLVEIITALKVVDFARPESEINLAALAVDRIRRGCVDEIIDPFIEPNRDAWTLYSVHKVAELAFRCLAFHSDMRPSMIEVAEELEHVRHSGWATMEENICTASSGGSSYSSSRFGSEKSLSDVNVEKVAQGSERLIVPQRTESYMHSEEEVKDSSPVSMHDPWLSGHSSPSTNSLLGNLVQ